MGYYDQMRIAKYYKVFRRKVSAGVVMDDYSLIGLKEGELYERGGRRTKKTYSDSRGVVTQKLYEDITEEGLLVSIQTTHQWLGKNDKVIVSKTTERSISNDNREKILERRREQNISHLKGIARGSALEPVIDKIFATYQMQINSYIKIGSTDFLANILLGLLPELNAETGVDHPTEERKLLVKEVIAYEIQPA